MKRLSGIRLARKATHLGSGEILGRACSISVIVFLGREYGVVILGVYGLALAISRAANPFIDFGLTHVGARLLARHPEHGAEIVRLVQRRRFLMAVLTLPLLIAYAISMRLPFHLKLFVLIFSSTSTLYAVSLEWAAWGKESLKLLGFARALVPFSILVFVVVGAWQSGHVLWWAAAGNGVGYCAVGVVLWLWWQRQLPPQSSTGPVQIPSDILAPLIFRRTSIMGLAWFAQIAFNSIDTLMLGQMSSPQQVGLYSAAYRILTQVLVTYYLILLSAYPTFARQDAKDRNKALRVSLLLTLVGLGSAIATAIARMRHLIIMVVFGHQFVGAMALLAVVIWAIPLDFVTSYLNNAYFAWGMEKRVLVCVGVAAAVDIVSNIIWIPRYGAMAAAVNTIVSYLVYLAGLLLVRCNTRIHLVGSVSLSKETCQV
jgi:O-antigen/teichoic acid export membrane protein